MQHNTIASRHDQARRALLHLALIVFPVTAAQAHSGVTILPNLHAALPGAPPYLRFVAPPPLRFQEPARPPDLESPTPNGAPPDPGSLGTDPPPQAAANPATPPTISAPEPAPTTIAPPAGQPAAAPATRPPPEIMADEVAPRVRIEDFLPFFEMPGRRLDSAPPPSSATYRLK